MSVRILLGDVRERLADLPSDSVDCVVTSPPYWGLRDYGVVGQLGLEPTWQEHIAVMGDIFDEVRRVLKPEGTLWLNYGDSYATSVNGRSAADTKATGNDDRTFRDKPFSTVGGVLKPKDLCGIPWRVAFALQERGWWLRQDIIWSKPNPMPESIRDRCTKAHEYLFLLAKSERYYFDQEAIKEEAVSDHDSGNGFAGRQGGAAHLPMSGGAGSTEPWKASRRPKAWDVDMGSNRTLIAGQPRKLGAKGEEAPPEVRSSAGARMGRGAGFRDDPSTQPTKRNRRSVWKVNTQAFPEAHFATFPPSLIEPCILAGCPKGGTVLDPFFGAGTTGLVADRLGRSCIGIELNPEYAEIARKRLHADCSLFADISIEHTGPSTRAA